VVGDDFRYTVPATRTKCPVKPLCRDLHTALRGLLTLQIFVYISPMAVEKYTNNRNKLVWWLLLEIFTFRERKL